MYKYPPVTPFFLPIYISPSPQLMQAWQEGTMKHSSRSHGLLPLLLLLLLLFDTMLSVYTTRASCLPSQPELEAQNARVDDLTLLGHAADQTEEKYSWELMEREKCEEEDDPCLKRRMISEAHLDYIYTQRQNP
ncbi:phytosulfokine 2 [Cocos nucifera]|uniref:Phytosulfokine n=1 Tax=Cocos nucifera TaxID=13894 RepID=A0A8K0IWA2_COCNU|nr:phytosulfokine 2 [Cocos nucifera]